MAFPSIVHVIDDDASLRTALGRLLAASGYQVALYGCAGDFLDAMAAGRVLDGCILLDIDMPGLSGVQMQERLNQQNSDLPIVFLTGQGDITTSVRTIKAGAEDFLCKPVDKDSLIDAIERGLAGYRKKQESKASQQSIQDRLNSLTPREREVFNLLIKGMLNKQIAYQLGNAERTVKAHRHNIMEKMGMKSVAELVAAASHLRLI